MVPNINFEFTGVRDFTSYDCHSNFHHKFMKFISHDLRYDIWCIQHQEVQGLVSPAWLFLPQLNLIELYGEITDIQKPKKSILDRKIFMHWYNLWALPCKQHTFI